MKAVLMSIQPKWCEKIANGEKTVEVRKSRPKFATPFKVYIYCTKSKKHFLQSKDNMFFYCEESDFIGKHGAGLYQRLNGRVIGEFVCDRIDSYVGKDDDNKEYWDLSVKEWEDLKKKSCLTIGQIIDYTGDSNNCYGWHISDLKIYDKPKELSEFFYACKQPKGTDCSQCIDRREKTCYSITRPPQSWCYVEVRE